MTRKATIITGTMILILIVMIISCTPAVLEEVTPADFYKGNTIDFITCASTGGWTDLTARTIASYLAEDTDSTVIINNMKEAGGLEGMNYLFRSKSDGSTLGVSTMSKLVGNQILDEPAAVYEIEMFSYIMNVGRGFYYFFISPEGPYQSVADLKAGENLKFGGSSLSGPISLGGLTAIKVLGLDAKVITGIGEETERALAVKRGEIIGYIQSRYAAKAGVEAGMLKPIFVMATERDPLMPDVPAISELINLTGEDLDLVRLWEVSLVSSVVFTAPPDIPEERLAFLRELANNWTNDDEFRAEVNQAFGFEVQEYITGDEVARSMLDTATALNEFRAIFTDLIAKYRA